MLDGGMHPSYVPNAKAAQRTYPYATPVQRHKKKGKTDLESLTTNEKMAGSQHVSTVTDEASSSKKELKKDKKKRHSELEVEPVSNMGDEQSEREKKKKKKKKDKEQKEISSEPIVSTSSPVKGKSKKRKADEEDPSQYASPKVKEVNSENVKAGKEIDRNGSRQDNADSNKSKDGEKNESTKQKSKKKQSGQNASSNLIEERVTANGKDVSHTDDQDKTKGHKASENEKEAEAVVPDETQESPAVQKKNKAGVQDRLDALMKNQPSQTHSISHRTKKASQTDQLPRQPGSNRKTNKDYFLLMLDKQMTHEDMLAKELFYYNQLRWLEEERGLKIKKGPFDKSEEAIIKDTLEEWKEKLSMDQEAFNDFVLEKREDPEKAKHYSQLWQEMTSRLVGRPNRSVRTHVRRHLTTYNFKTGHWSDEEQKALEDGVKEHGFTWSKIAKKVNRSPEHCRLRWRDYKGDGKLQRQKGKWSDAEDERLHKAVKESQDEFKEDREKDEEKDNSFWDHVCTKMEGARSGRQCESRWRILNPKGGRSAFYSQPTDGPILIQLLNEQAGGAQNDNFSDVNLKKILQVQPKWTVKIIKRAWRSMVDRFVIPKGEENVDHYQDFRNRLNIIQESMDRIEKEKMVEGSKKRKRRPSKKDSEDLVESDNEVDLLMKGEEQNKTKSNNDVEKTQNKKKKTNSVEKRKKKGQESDDSIGGVSE